MSISRFRARLIPHSPGIKPRTFLLWGDCANHAPTVPNEQLHTKKHSEINRILSTLLKIVHTSSLMLVYFYIVWLTLWITALVFDDFWNIFWFSSGKFLMDGLLFVDQWNKTLFLLLFYFAEVDTCVIFVDTETSELPISLWFSSIWSILRLCPHLNFGKAKYIALFCLKKT